MRRVLALALVTLLAAPQGMVLAEDSPQALIEEGQKLEATDAAGLEKAAKLYRELLEKFPKHDLAPRARLRLGLVLAKQGKTEDARARLREARATGKADPELCKEAEKALLELPPPPEPKKGEPAKPLPEKPQDKPAPPKPPETGPRAQLMAEIAALEQEVRDLVKQAQELEDQNKMPEAYRLRAQADEKSVALANKKKELAKLPPPPRNVAPPPRKEEKREMKPEDPGMKRKLVQRRKEELEALGKQLQQKAGELSAQGKAVEAAQALEQANKAYREAAELGKRLEEKDRDASQPEMDPAAKKEQEHGEAVAAARRAVVEAEKSGDPEKAKRAREELAAREKALHELQEEREARAEKAQLERLAENMKKRGAPPFEVEERLAFAKKELELGRNHRHRLQQLRREMKEKKIAEAEVKNRLESEEKGQREAVEKLRAEGEERIAARGRAEVDREVERRVAELKAKGLPPAQIEERAAEIRRELEWKLLGKKPEKRDPMKGDEESERPMRRAIMEENARLRRRVEELEKELAAARAKLREVERGAQAAITSTTR